MVLPSVTDAVFCKNLLTIQSFTPPAAIPAIKNLLQIKKMITTGNVARNVPHMTAP